MSDSTNTVKPGKIYKAIANCMKDIGAVGKNQRNDQQKFMYRGIDAVMNAINPALVKNGIFVAPERFAKTDRLGMVVLLSIQYVKSNIPFLLMMVQIYQQ